MKKVTLILTVVIAAVMMFANISFSQEPDSELLLPAVTNNSREVRERQTEYDVYTDKAEFENAIKGASYSEFPTENAPMFAPDIPSPEHNQEVISSALEGVSVKVAGLETKGSTINVKGVDFKLPSNVYVEHYIQSGESSESVTVPIVTPLFVLRNEKNKGENEVVILNGNGELYTYSDNPEKLMVDFGAVLGASKLAVRDSVTNELVDGEVSASAIQTTPIDYYDFTSQDPEKQSGTFWRNFIFHKWYAHATLYPSSTYGYLRQMRWGTYDTGAYRRNLIRTSINTWKNVDNIIGIDWHETYEDTSGSSANWDLEVIFTGCPGISAFLACVTSDQFKLFGIQKVSTWEYATVYMSPSAPEQQKIMNHEFGHVYGLNDRYYVSGCNTAEVTIMDKWPCLTSIPSSDDISKINEYYFQGGLYNKSWSWYDAANSKMKDSFKDNSYGEFVTYMYKYRWTGSYWHLIGTELVFDNVGGKHGAANFSNFVYTEWSPTQNGTHVTCMWPWLGTKNNGQKIRGLWSCGYQQYVSNK